VKQRTTLQVRQTDEVGTRDVTSNSMHRVIVSVQLVEDGGAGKSKSNENAGGSGTGVFAGGNQTICAPLSSGTTGGLHPGVSGWSCGKLATIGPAVPHVFAENVCEALSTVASTCVTRFIPVTTACNVWAFAVVDESCGPLITALTMMSPQQLF
jgi:hypothetical protein